MKEDLFTNKQLTRFANILDNAGQVVLASVVLPLLLGTIDLSISRMVIFAGAMGTIVCWWISLRLERLAS